MPLRDDVEIAPYDYSDYIRTADDARTSIASAFEDGDTTIINRAIGAVARSKGMTALSAETGITRDGLYKSLAPDGNPSLRTVLSVLAALGLGLRPVALTPAPASTSPTKPRVAVAARPRQKTMRPKAPRAASTEPA